MSKLIDSLRELEVSLDNDAASIIEAAIITITRLEKFKADAESDLAKLNALEAHGVDNWQGYDEAMRSLSDEDEDDE